MITDLKVNEEKRREYYEKGYWSPKTLNDVWNDSVSSYGDLEYVSDDTGVRFTYGELDEKAARFSSWLKDIGIQNGDVVTFQCPSWSEFCIIYVACLKVGAVMHPLSIRFNVEDMVYSMNLVGSKALITPTTFRKMDYEEQNAQVLERVESLKKEAVCVIDKETPARDSITMREILEKYPMNTEAPESKSEDVALIIMTSGTTSRPKATLITHNNLVFSERVFSKGYHLTHDDICFMPSPLNHATGFNHGLISTMQLGARVILQQKFDAVEAINIMNREKATWTMGATPFIYDMLNCAEKDDMKFETLRLFICGGAPVPGVMIKRAYNHGVLLCESYGATESCPHVAVPPENCLEWNGDWSGVALEGIEVRVVDEEGNDVPYGELGEEISRGPNTFVGYLNNKEATDDTLTDDGWVKSGDICVWDEMGRIKVKGRKKDILIRGGENISTNEVDYDLIGCPGVGAHSTIGMPDERLGERICTFVMVKDGIVPTVESVSKYLASKGVAKRLWPEFIEIIDMIPATESGKVKRYELKLELERRLAERGKENH